MKKKIDSKIMKIIDTGIRRAVAEAIKGHKKSGHSIAVSRNGKIVIVPARKISG